LIQQSLMIDPVPRLQLKAFVSNDPDDDFDELEL
jgi:hypothetical protein